MRVLQFLSLFFASLLIVLIIPSVFYGCKENNILPDDDNAIIREPYPWRISTPAVEGVDTVKITEAVEALRSVPYVFSALVVRNDALIVEYYRGNLNQQNDFEARSISKIVTSALVGIALREGIIDSLNQRMMDYFPDLATSELDPRAYDVTIEHLLTMRSGFDYSDITGPFDRFTDNSNWLKEEIHLPFKTNPGERFSYATPNVNILAGIITRASGMSARDFAERNLFGPLLIAPRQWNKDPQGIYLGGTGMSFTARDLARIGYLYLKQGTVDNQEILPGSWTAASVTPRNEPLGSYGDFTNTNFGYLWWTNYTATTDIFFSVGYAGQFIFIIPSANSVVVTTANTSTTLQEAGQQETYIINVLVNKILPALSP